MSRYWIALFFAGISAIAVAQETSTAKVHKIQYYGRESFLIEGTALVDSEKENSYDRLPLSYKEKVRKQVWDLSKASAGLSIRFFSNSTALKVKWELLNDLKMNHMAETGIKGIDLYCRIEGHWQYINTGRPSGKKNEALLVENMSAKMREYRLYLPLYDGVTIMEVGIDSTAMIVKPAASTRPTIVFYGTSITQGGCASRPGMVYTSIISRKLDVECINFGFSGNGRMEKPIVELMAEIDASLYVVDCISNMTAGQIRENTVPLVESIRNRRPDAPIVFVEGMLYDKTVLDDSARAAMNNKNSVLRSEYEKMAAKGFTNLFYIDNNGALGNDHEGTVDGAHFTDLGFMRFAEYLLTRFEHFGLNVQTKTMN
ncbi:MAG: SGNH/GDSL hydrolase family protein [Ignavibacteriales bacterium]|nr:SGNH/GDSL hydrolase family protein [Ignavibacteriales bacterium]